MSRFLFAVDSPELIDLYTTEENIRFLGRLFLIFHQIFLYRLTDIELDLSRYASLKTDRLDTFEASANFTRYRVYREIIESVQGDPILMDNFILFNSYGKISFSSFVKIASSKITGFDPVQFWLLLVGQDPEEKLSLDARLIDDFTLTKEWYDYMDTLRVSGDISAK